MDELSGIIRVSVTRLFAFELVTLLFQVEDDVICVWFSDGKWVDVMFWVCEEKSVSICLYRVIELCDRGDEFGSFGCWSSFRKFLIRSSNLFLVTFLTTMIDFLIMQSPRNCK